MKTLQDKYNLIVEGKGDIANFKREAVNAQSTTTVHSKSLAEAA